jgi:hypothetical protein
MFWKEMDYIINSGGGLLWYNYNCSKYPEGVYIIKLTVAGLLQLKNVV